ncbi:MAG: GH32 C-terminal domain-containing protein [Planctomycetota bacterium]|jgi:sucrose-6-phosphate hydrolase SacC (GH32 family)
MFSKQLNGKYQIKAIAVVVLFVFGSQLLEGAGRPEIKDKTLVVWTAPANLEQRGGSALTIDDLEGHFDGIVFGEIAKAKWMAGSDHYRRSEKEQKEYGKETAGKNTFVQIAIVYKGAQVTIYRKGKVYESYKIEERRDFGPGSIVMFGQRHAAGPDSGYYQGKIDDARIYDVALTAKQIAKLRPNKLSDIKPVGWWPFEKGSIADQMGNFAETYLAGAAKIEKGKLVLEGKQPVMVAAPKGFIASMLSSTGAESEHGSLIDAQKNLREKFLKDPYRPVYHFVIPEGFGDPFDPNGAIFWNGRYHLFYIFQDQRGHNWGHVSSTDLVHWRHHPTGLAGGMYSGNCFINKEGVPTMCFHDEQRQNNTMAVALDDELNDWKKLALITPKTTEGDKYHDRYASWDPFGWLEGDTYYAIFGGEMPGIAKCKDLEGDWEYVGDLFAHGIEGVSLKEDVSCADLFKIGDKYMLLCISHRMGCRYYLGQWKDEQFYPQFHEQMSWVDNAYFAPESLLDDKGRRIMWAWIFDRREDETIEASGWSGTMSLPRVLWLGADGMLRMKVPEELQMLRYNEQRRAGLTVKADDDLPLKGISGNSIELKLEIDPAGAKQVGLKVCCSPNAEEETLVYYDAADKKLKIDTHKSSLGEGPKKTEAGPFELGAGESLKLQVFVDKSVVEVFANDRQAVMRRIYPTRTDSVGVKLFSKGGSATVRKLQAWDMMPSNAN